MLKSEYPVFTVIMRGYSLEVADMIVSQMTDFGQYFSVEVTLNSDNALGIIEHLSKTYGDRVKIGAGTVRKLDELIEAVEAGAEFVLGPHEFTKEMIDYCKANQIVSVPSGMTPSEISRMFDYGADIVKVFPAAVVTPRFFKDIQAPLGDLSLMAVGGIGQSNVKAFYDAGTKHLGMGSSMFAPGVLENSNKEAIRETYEALIKLIEE